MNKFEDIQTTVSDLNKARTESFTDWMRLHRLDKKTVDKYLNLALGYSMTRLVSNTRRDDLKIHQLDVRKTWKLTATAMIWFFPGQHRILKEVRDNAKLTINKDVELRNWSYTYFSAKAKTLMVGITFKNKPEDILTVAHEYGHCVQLISTEENFIPPIFREACAFLAELIFLKYLAKVHPKLHMELIESWYRRNNYYLGKCSKMLCIAKNADLQPYTYEWNYPVARIFSIIAFDNMGNEKIWRLFSNSDLFFESISFYSTLKSQRISLIFLQPIAVVDGQISVYALLGILALREALENSPDRSKNTIKGFYDMCVTKFIKNKVVVKIDHLMRPIHGKRMAEISGQQLKIARNTRIDGKADMYSSLGFAIELLSLSSYHKEIFMNYYIQKNFLPPLRHQQIKFYFSSSGVPIAYVTWARVSEAIMTDIELTRRPLQLTDWKSGKEFFFNDFVSPYGYTKFVIRDFKQNIAPPGSVGRSLQRNQDGSVQRIRRWVGRKNIESGDEIQKDNAEANLPDSN